MLWNMLFFPERLDQLNSNRTMNYPFYKVNKETRRRVMEEIEKCDCPHFLILFRDSKLQFRALYAYYPDTEEVE